MTVWRYLSTEYACQAFEKGFWKIGRIAELNDPLDCRPVVLRERGRLDVDPEGYPLLDHLTQNIGLLCYSKSVEDPAVWAHYGDNHRGIALGFDFPPDEAPLEMRYRRKRARFYSKELLEMELDRTIYFEVIQKGWLVKSPGWRFEREFRHFLFLGAEGVTFSRPHYYRTVPWERLRHVVIGIRSPMTVLDVTKMLRSIEAIDHSRLFVYKAQVDRLNYRIEAGVTKVISRRP